jgi:hypothetical protein
MKNILLSISSLFIIVSITSCDKVEQPIKPAINVDTTLFVDGNWADYPMPTFESNTNTNRNLLLEDYTGHKCPNCPAAASVATEIEENNLDRVFVVSIHTGAGGDGNFQKTSSNCGTAENPENEFCYDFTTVEGNEYGITFQPFGFVGNPYGNISRYTFSDAMFQFHTSWVEKTNQLLTENVLTANLQAKNNYFDASNGGYLHVETQFLEDLTGNYNLVTYVIENEIVEWQDSVGTHLEDYHHHNVFLGCVDGLPWGQNLVTNPSSGDIVQKDYSYVLPSGLEKEGMHFISYVYNVETYEVLQVIKHTF